MYAHLFQYLLCSALGLQDTEVDKLIKIVNIRWIIRALPVIYLFDYCNTCDLKDFLNLPSIGGS